MKGEEATLTARRMTAPVFGSQTLRLYFTWSVMETPQPKASYSGVLMCESPSHFLLILP